MHRATKDTFQREENKSCPQLLVNDHNQRRIRLGNIININQVNHGTIDCKNISVQTLRVEHLMERIQIHLTRDI